MTAYSIWGLIQLYEDYLLIWGVGVVTNLGFILFFMSARPVERVGDIKKIETFHKRESKEGVMVF